MSKNVELLSHFGDDLMVVNVARVSYGKVSESFGEKDAKLLNYLVKHGHTSPFRHPQLQMRVSCSIVIERQLFKHQVGISVNSISGRYVDFSDSYSEVGTWRKQSTSSKQGSDGPVENQEACRDIEKLVIDTCREAYATLLDLGVSKEQARTVLPLSLNTTYIWTGSMLALVHLLKLRLKPDTQQETREVAQQMLDAVRNIEGNPFEHTLKAFEL